MSQRRIEEDALKLDPRARARLAGKLLDSLEELSDAERDTLWAEEAERRDAELETGAAEPRPAADVFGAARRRLK